MVDYEILAESGLTSERLKQIFTAEMPENYRTLPKDEVKRLKKDIKTRKFFEDEINSRTVEGMSFSLRNHYLYSAVDLAWDSSPINKATYPLMLYAQGKLDVQACATKLSELKCADNFVKKDKDGKVVDVEIPRFIEVVMNLVRRFITRRLAAQSNKYNNLYPCYKYESRSTGLVGKCRADVISQVVEIMCDQYGYRHHDVQVMRDMFLYAHGVSFPSSSWEVEKAWVRDPLSPRLGKGQPITKKTVVVKEGVPFTNPHPLRVFADNNYPLTSINTDTGCEFIGFWDVGRYGDVQDNPAYFNKEHISYSSGMVQMFTGFPQFFEQYYDTIVPPTIPQEGASQRNDRKNNVGSYAYSNEMRDTAMFKTEYFRKLIPNQHGMGNYPFPVWVRFVAAGDNTVIFAEVMPSSPAAVASYNENDNRLVNISEAHELMSYQDQLTNLQSQLLLTLRSDAHKVLLLDIDVLEPEQLAHFRKQAKGANYYSTVQVLEISRKKLAEMNIDVTKVIHLAETTPGTAVTLIFQAMLHLISMIEKLMALSPQEQGQAAPREISATEVNSIASTTESVYSFISDSIDEYRAAKKRILYESIIAKRQSKFQVPVINRYPKEVILRAGFQVVEDEQEELNDPGKARLHTVIGSTSELVHDYVFTSRDGAERAVNTQSANTLVQLLAALGGNPVIMAALKKAKLYEIVNEIFRLSGTAIDLNLELEPGEDNRLGPDPNEQIQQILQQIVQTVKKNTEDIQTNAQQCQATAEHQKQVEAILQKLTDAVRHNTEKQSTPNPA